MSLRIIAGELGGRRIQAPAGRTARPTRDAVREAWFSAIDDRIPGARVLDLYAGSGALGLEALSRGAATVLFVESDRRVLGVLRRNLAALDVEGRAEVAGRDALSVARDLPTGAAREWDIVLADPPYADGGAAELATIFARGAFADMLCVEHAVGVRFTMEPDWQRTYGETVLSIFLDPAGGATHG